MKFFVETLPPPDGTVSIHLEFTVDQNEPFTHDDLKDVIQTDYHVPHLGRQIFRFRGKSYDDGSLPTIKSGYVLHLELRPDCPSPVPTTLR